MAGDELPPFPAATPDTLGTVGPGLDGEQLIMGRNGQGGIAGGAIDNRQTRGNRDATSETSGDPRPHPARPLHSQRQRLHLLATERVNRQQGGDGADQQDLRGDHEQPVRDKETARAGVVAPGQGAANLPRPRAAKVEGRRIPGLPIHITAQNAWQTVMLTRSPASRADLSGL